MIKGISGEEFDAEAAEGLDSVVRDWVQQLQDGSGDAKAKLRGAVYQGALLGLQIAARARAQAAKKLAADLGVQLDKDGESDGAN